MCDVDQPFFHLNYAWGSTGHICRDESWRMMLLGFPLKLEEVGNGGLSGGLPKDCNIV